MCRCSPLSARRCLPVAVASCGEDALHGTRTPSVCQVLSANVDCKDSGSETVWIVRQIVRVGLRVSAPAAGLGSAQPGFHVALKYGRHFITVTVHYSLQHFVKVPLVKNPLQAMHRKVCCAPQWPVVPACESITFSTSSLRISVAII